MFRIRYFLLAAGLAVLSAQPTPAQPDFGALSKTRNTTKFDPFEQYDAQQRVVFDAFYSFWNAVERSDATAAAKFVAGADGTNADLKELSQQWAVARGNLSKNRIGISGLPDITIDGNQAQITVPLLSTDILRRAIAGNETLQLHRQGEGKEARWLIEPGQAVRVWENLMAGYLYKSATAVAHPRETLTQFYLLRSDLNLQSLFNAIQAFGTDEKDHITLSLHNADIAGMVKKQNSRRYFTDDDLQEAVVAPGGVPYTYNEKLNGLALMPNLPLTTPSEEVKKRFAAYDEKLKHLVMVYEGTDEKPLFRYNGQALILFATGKTELVLQKEAATLRFSP